MFLFFVVEVTSFGCLGTRQPVCACSGAGDAIRIHPSGSLSLQDGFSLGKCRQVIS